MVNRGYWGEQELADLVALYHPGEGIPENHRRFQAAGYGTRSYHAYRVKLREALNGQTPQVVHPKASGRSSRLQPPPPPEITGVLAGERPDIAAIRRKAEAEYEVRRAEHRRKQRQLIRIAYGPALIAFVADTHLGNPGTDTARVFAEQALINATPNAHTVLMGDVCDNFVIGKLVAQNMTHGVTITEEWELFLHYLAGWTNLRAVVGGNHDAWTPRLIGLDVHRRLLDGSVLYDTDDMRVTVEVGGHPVKFRLRHKWRGFSQYNVTHGQEKSIAFDDPDPDVVVGGHTHRGALARELVHAGRRKIAIQLGSYKALDDYAVVEGFPMRDASTAAAVLIMADGSVLATGSLAAACAFMRAAYAEA